jgi:hypothetical protein
LKNIWKKKNYPTIGPIGRAKKGNTRKFKYSDVSNYARINLCSLFLFTLKMFS